MAHPDVQDEQRLTAKGRATRDRIVEAAAQLIVTEGLSASNMENVRRAASVSGSQLAHYFADKNALIRAVIRRQIGVVLDFHRQPKLGGLASFADFERWADLNMRYLRRIGYFGTPTYHALAAQLAKSDDATRETLGAGYWQWVDLLDAAIQRMKDDGIVVAEADSRALAIVIVAAHQGGGTLAFTYRAEWPHADAVRFAINHLRSFATDPGERVARPARRPRRLREGRALTDDSSTRFTRKGQATRARVVEVAARLMFERGVAGTSIEQVRRAAGVGGSQIAHYFQDKRELTRQVIAARREDVRAFHTAPPLGDLDTLQALQAWADACVADTDAVYRLGGCVYGALAGELIDADDEVHDDLSAGYDQWIELFQTGLATMRRRGELRPDADPRHLAVSLVVAHQGGAMLTYATGDPEPLRTAVNAAVDYVRAFTPHARKSRSTPARRRGPTRAK
ncbi:TetR family transcriptional regulator [Mycobacterium sp. E342]|uniref:TetR/AcrR family transcriptional regulator n=1 Tax=Mycobacterium sp. E342 TaxID=1834147 RepID=UPI0007FEE7F5|nr:TetR/AcrR family transcriptional regulator [Mycobacterium sp. E342]OBH31022.1 TetR family transcriptional regulator [Mycobacterium sp. E342]